MRGLGMASSRDDLEARADEGSSRDELEARVHDATRAQDAALLRDLLREVASRREVATMDMVMLVSSEIGWVAGVELGDACAAALGGGVASAATESGSGCAHAAARLGRCDVLQRVCDIDRGAAARRNKKQQTPLHFACLAGHAAAARVLLGARADVVDQGRKRVRNSQLQRLISRSFSTRFG